jgi:hypothetical protein
MNREVALSCELASQMIESDRDELETSLLSLGRSLVGANDQELPDELVQDVVRVAPLHAYWDGLNDGKKVVRTALLVQFSRAIDGAQHGPAFGRPNCWGTHSKA